MEGRGPDARGNSKARIHYALKCRTNCTRTPPPPRKHKDAIHFAIGTEELVPFPYEADFMFLKHDQAIRPAVMLDSAVTGCRTHTDAATDGHRADTSDESEDGGPVDGGASAGHAAALPAATTSKEVAAAAKIAAAAAATRAPAASAGPTTKTRRRPR